MRLEWSLLALNDREAIFDYVAGENPAAAIRLDDRISERIKMLRQFPEAGRPGRISGTRELVISGTPYIAAYAIVSDAVRILRLLHGARLWPDDLGE